MAVSFMEFFLVLVLLSMAAALHLVDASEARDAIGHLKHLSNTVVVGPLPSNTFAANGAPPIWLVNDELTPLAA